MAQANNPINAWSRLRKHQRLRQIALESRSGRLPSRADPAHLDAASQKVPIMRQPCRKRRTIVEHKLRVALGPPQLLPVTNRERSRYGCAHLTNTCKACSQTPCNRMLLAVTRTIRAANLNNTPKEAVLSSHRPCSCLKLHSFLKGSGCNSSMHWIGVSTSFPSELKSALECVEFIPKIKDLHFLIREAQSFALAYRLHDCAARLRDAHCVTAEGVDMRCRINNKTQSNIPSEPQSRAQCLLA